MTEEATNAMGDVQTQLRVESAESEISLQEANLESARELYSMYRQQLLPTATTTRKDNSAMLENLDLASILPFATLRTRQLTQLAMEDHASAITSHLRLNTKLIQNDRKSEKLRIETLKAMPQCLSIKRSVKSKLQEAVSEGRRTKSIGYWTWLKYRSGYSLSKIQNVLRDVMPAFELWYHSIKSIEGQRGSGVAAYFKFLRWLVGLNIIFCALSLCFIVLPQALKETHATAEIAVSDFLTGSGFFANTVLYYGFYSNETVAEVSGIPYNIPSAYFLTSASCYILILILLSVKVAQSYRKCYIQIRGKVQNMYSNKVFCGWDFSISSSGAAVLHSGSLYRDLKESLAEAEQPQPRPECGERLLRIMIRVVVTVAVSAIICGTGLVLWILLERHKMDESNTLSVMLVPLVVTTVMQLFPAIIAYLAHFERYSSKRGEIYVTVIRIHAMAATVIAIHLVFWITNSTSHCWQTRLGEEIYRLILLDFIVVTFGTSVFEAARIFLHQRRCAWIRTPEFDIPRSTLNLIYNQMLFWLGSYFSPCLCLIVLAKMILIFYVKKYGLFKYYMPPARPWRAAQTETLFLALAFLGMIAVLTALGYIVTRIGSTDCGPFRAHENTWDYAISVILALRKDSKAWKVISELASPATGGIILTSMSIGVYCLRAKVEASREMLSILREMLLLQARDKEFLTRSISKITREHDLPASRSSASPLRAGRASARRYACSSEASRRRAVPSQGSPRQDDCV